MAVTLSTLRSQILFDTNRDSGTYGIAVVAAINTAISFMQSKYFWNFKKSGQITVLSGNNSVQLPSDFVSMATVQFVIGNTFYSLRQGFLNLSFEDLLAKFQTNASVGTPNCYAIFNNVFYVYPYVPGDTVFNIYYYFKDTFLPASDNDTSIWFGSDTIDMIRMKAMERFYHDTLQSPDLAAGYAQAFADFDSNFSLKNTNKQQYLMLSK